MVKRAKQVRKNKTTRIRKKLMVIGTEGSNKTEEIYFREMERRQNNYHVLFVPGNETDPVNIVKNTIRAKKKEALSINQGDIAVSVFDLDVEEKKKQQLYEAKKLAENENVRIVTSNPCFEVWYLEHFGYTSKSFQNSTEVIKDLVKHCPKYQKNSCEIELFYPLTEVAIRNCRLLSEFQKNHGSETIEEFNNPRTDVFKVVELLIDDKNAS